MEAVVSPSGMGQLMNVVSAEAALTSVATHLCDEQGANAVLKVMLLIHRYLPLIFVPHNVSLLFNICHL